MKDQIEQLTLFDKQEDEKSNESTTALPNSATIEWKNLYAAIANYAQRLNPSQK